MIAVGPSTGIQREGEAIMLTCPRCGSEAEYLADEVFPLVRCGFCGDDIDAADLALQAAVDRLVQALPSAPPERQRPSVDTRSA
jgi:hypothetical protein